MKKFTLPTLLCVLSLSFFSCSTESNEATTENTSTASFRLKSTIKIDTETAKQLYIKMMEPQEYTDYKNALATFTEKLKLNKVAATNKSEWMNWATINLNKTGFNDIIEFEKMYDDTVNKLDKMITENTTLYEFISTASLTQVGAVLEPEYNNHTVDYPTATNSCLNNCIDICESNLDTLETQHNQNLQNAVLAGDFGFTLAAEINYEIAYIEIALEFNDCAGSC